MWQQRQATLWQRAPMLRFVPALCLGIIAYYSFNIHLPRWVLLSIIVSSGSSLIAVNLIRKTNRTLTIVRLAILQTFLIAIGLAVSAIADHRNNPDWYGHQLSSAAAFIAVVDDAPDKRARSWRLRLSVEASIDSNSVVSNATGKLLLYTYLNTDSSAPFQQGDRILLPAALSEIKNAGNPFDFDYKTFSQRNNIYHSAILAPEDIAVVEEAKNLGFVAIAHNWCVSQLRRYLPSSESFGLLHAMLMGDERDFDPSLRQTYAETGIVHLIAISGSHVATIYLFITIIFIGLKRRRRLRFLPLVIGVVVVWLYAFLAGAPPSALRSVLMFTVFAGALLSGRDRSPFNTLLVAAFILLLFHPSWLYAVGFQLSFLAVLSLITFFKPIASLWWPRFWLLKTVRDLAAASLAVELLVAPLVAFYFHNFPVLFLLSNIVAYVFIGLAAMFGGLLILIFFWWTPVAHAIGWVIAFLIEIFNKWLIAMNGKFSPAAMRHINLSALDLLLMLAVVAGLGLFWLKKKRYGITVMLSASCLLMASFITQDWVALHQERFVVYNLNRHLLAEVHQGRNHFVLAADTNLDIDRGVAAARIGYQSWRAGDIHNKGALSFNNKTIYILQKPVALDEPFTKPIDVLVIGYPLQIKTLPAIFKILRPKKIVVAGYQKLWVKKVLEANQKDNTYPLHLVWQDGAFIKE